MFSFPSVLSIFSLIANYLFCALGYGYILKNRKLNRCYLAFIPIINESFVLGKIYDDIQKDYKQYKRQALKLFLLKLLSLLSFICFFFILIFVMSSASGLSLGLLDYNLYSQFLDKSDPLWRSIFLLTLFVALIINIVYLVCYFKTLYVVFKEYDPKRAALYFIVCVFGVLFISVEFLGPLFVYLMRKNVPQFVLLNTKSSVSVQ